MITQEDIYFFFEKIAEEFRKENIPILNCIMYDFKDYPTMDNLETIDEISEEDNSEYEEQENLESS